MSPKHPNCVAIEADLVAAATREAAPKPAPASVWPRACTSCAGVS